MTEAIRAIIVDDERLARKELRAMLAEHLHIEVAGEAGSVEQATKLIREQQPDAVFLDIQMPGESGFDLIEKMEIEARIVFVTAFDQYAIRAFEVNALDYLLKPVNPERLARAIQRLCAKETPPQQAVRRLEYDDRLFIELDDRSRFLKIASIVAVCAAGDYSEIIMADGTKSLVMKSLKEWEERLPEKHFVRIHRSTIINLEYIENIESWFNRSYRVYLRHIAEPFVVSRRYASQLKLKFG